MIVMQLVTTFNIYTYVDHICVLLKILMIYFETIGAEHEQMTIVNEMHCNALEPKALSNSVKNVHLLDSSRRKTIVLQPQSGEGLNCKSFVAKLTQSIFIRYCYLLS